MIKLIQTTTKLGKFLEAVSEIVVKMILHGDYRVQYNALVKISDRKNEFIKRGKLFDQISYTYMLKKNYKL